MHWEDATQATGLSYEEIFENTPWRKVKPMLLCVGRIDSAVYQYDDDNALVSSKQVLLIFPLTTDNKQTKYKYKESLVCLLIWFLE